MRQAKVEDLKFALSDATGVIALFLESSTNKQPAIPLFAFGRRTPDVRETVVEKGVVRDPARPYHSIIQKSA